MMRRRDVTLGTFIVFFHLGLNLAMMMNLEFSQVSSTVCMQGPLESRLLAMM